MIIRKLFGILTGTNCPKCGGELKHLGQETYQCVKCKRKFDYYA